MIAETENSNASGDQSPEQQVPPQSESTPPAPAASGLPNNEAPPNEPPAAEIAAGGDVTGELPIDNPPTDAEIDDTSLDEEDADVEEEDESAPVGHAEPLEFIDESRADEDLKFEWYILKVQTNREESIRDALQRRVAMAGLEKFFGEIIVPTEMVSEFKGGKKRVSKRKLYPGYIVVNMEINDDTWYLVRETSGIGDFTGAMGRPTPMAQQDVDKIVAKTEVKTDEAPRVDIRFKPADRVRIKEGTFENFEGNVEAIDQANGRVTVMINIFGRSTPVELEYWQIEAV